MQEGASCLQEAVAAAGGGGPGPSWGGAAAP